MQAIGIDIGTYCLKMALLRQEPEGRFSCTVHSLPTPTDAVKAGVVVRQREVGYCLRRMWRALGGSERKATAAVPMDQAVLRWLDLPPMTETDLIAAAPFEARKYISYPVEKAEVAIRAFDSANIQGMRALLTVSPTEVVVSRAEALEAAGIEVAAMELEPFPVLRAVGELRRGHAGFWRGQSIGFLMIGEEKSGLFIVQDGKPVFMRSILWGTGRLYASLGAALGCTIEEARQCIEGGTASVTSEGILCWEQAGENRQSDRFTMELEPLARETARLLSYYRSLYPERSYEGTLASLLIGGGITDLPGISTFLSRRLEVTVAPYRVASDRLGGAIQVAPAGLIRAAGAYAVAIGLAQGALATPRVATVATPLHAHVWRRAAA